MSALCDYVLMVSGAPADLDRFHRDPSRLIPPGTYPVKLGEHITENVDDCLWGSLRAGGRTCAPQLDRCHRLYWWQVNHGAWHGDWLDALARANPNLTFAFAEDWSDKFDDGRLAVRLAFGWDGMMEWLGDFDGPTLDTFLDGLAFHEDWLRIACVDALWHAPATFCSWCGDFVAGRAWLDCDAVIEEHHNDMHHRDSSGILVYAVGTAPGPSAGANAGRTAP